MFVAHSTPATGTVASAESSYPSAEAIRALVIQAASVGCPLSLGIPAQRKLILERVDKNDTVLTTASYEMPNVGGSDRAITFAVDVAIHNGAALQARIDACGAGESQWVVINYQYQRAPN